MKKVIIGLLFLAAIGLIFYNFSKIPNRSNIPGGFDEVAYIRNENNLGTVLLYYAFTVRDTAQADYMALGKTLPFNKTNGITTAFMFDKASPAPTQLRLEAPHFDTTQYQAIAVYRVDQVGNRTVTRY